MFVFWWQGKGFFTLLIVVAVAIATGMIADAAHLPSYVPLFWAVVLLVSAPIVWVVGRRLNAKRRASTRPDTVVKQLFYRARHKFMSLPMESWAIVMATAATAIFATSALRR